MALQISELKRRRLTLEDYNALPDDADYEIIDGVLYVAPRARPSHQMVQAELIAELRSHVRPRGLGRVVPDADLVVDEHGTYVSPDIMYFSADKMAQIDPDQQIRVVPDLIVEILSPSTARRDLVTKMNAYARIGVPHYWIVDRGQPGVLECVLGANGKYQEREVEADQPFRPALFPDLEIDLAQVFA
jgi:Uma2 family endonuclease